MVIIRSSIACMMLMLFFFIQTAASEEDLPVRSTTRNLVFPYDLADNRPSCESDQGMFTIEAKYDGEPGTFNIATTALGEDADAPEVYHLQPFEDDLSYGVTHHGCFKMDTLHRFVIYVQKPEMNDPSPHGDYNLTVNGRQIISATTHSANENFTQYFFAGDSEVCNGERFTLTIHFDARPFEISWLLENESDDAVVPFTYESTLKNNSSMLRYTSDFDNATLFVDHCLVFGDLYRFSIADAAHDGLLFPGFYEIASNGVVILRALGGSPFSSRIRFFQSDGSPATLPPVITPTLPTAPACPPSAAGAPASGLHDTEKPTSPASTPTSGFDAYDPMSRGDVVIEACFTAFTTVFVKDKGDTKMSGLKIGDYVAVGGTSGDGSSSYEPIYSFGHFEPNGDVTPDFLEIVTNQTTNHLQVSPDHLIFAYNKMQTPGVVDVAAVPAASIRVGDLLVYTDKGRQTAALVEAIKPLSVTSGVGLYAPFTPSGKFVVNGGLLVSSFVGFGHQMKTDWWSTSRGVLGLSSWHWLAHSFEFPHRVVCYHLGTCPDETYTAENGLSTWVAWPLEVTLRVMNLESGLLKCIFLGAVMCMCCIFSILEFTFFQQPLMLLLGGASWLLLFPPRKFAGRKSVY